MPSLAVNTISCAGCGACASACPEGCISFIRDKEGFSYPHADSRCTQCGVCRAVCPSEGQGTWSSEGLQLSYATRHIDLSIWRESTSGGAFSAICHAYCGEGDAVVGVRFEGLRAVHERVLWPTGIERFRRSKYVQSEPLAIHSDIRTLLEEGRKVLFSGTPCQVAGLRHYLGRDYDGLLCIDLICSGVGSPGVFEQYIKCIERKKGSRVTSFSFRNKRLKWGRLLEYQTVIQLENGAVIEESHDLYNEAFLAGLILRPSCYQCLYAKAERLGDLTIGDLKDRYELILKHRSLENWSAVIVNTEKGLRVFESAKALLVTHSVDFERLVASNSGLREASGVHPNRTQLFHRLEEGEPIDYAIAASMITPSLKHKVWAALPDMVRALVKGGMRWIGR